MRIGVLYPRSKAHPGIMSDFMDGLKTALQFVQLNQQVQLVSESIGYGGQEKEVYEKAEKLLVLEGVDLLVAYVDLRILEILKPLLFATGKLVLAVNPGANYPENWVPQPNILNLTLNHGYLCRLTGKLAAGMTGKNAVMATSFYDCGYLHTAAMVKGFVNDGGRITYNYVNNQLYDDSFEINALTEYLAGDKETNSLLCVFDSLPASLFYAGLNAFEGAAGLSLFVSPMMLEAQALEKMNGVFKFNINGYLPWHVSAENEANRLFMENYSRQTKRVANIFALLGWETGLVIREVSVNSSANDTDGAAMAIQLAGSIINSPRGDLKLDTRTNYFIAPVYKCSLTQQSPVLSITKHENPEAEWTAFVAMPTEGVSSGWTNTYLCY